MTLLFLCRYGNLETLTVTVSFRAVIGLPRGAHLQEIMQKLV